MAQSKKVDSFNSIEISGSISAELIASDEERVEYKITKGDSENLIIKNEGNSLIVKIKNKWSGRSNTSAKIKIYYKSIVDLEVSSGSSVLAVDMIEVDKFDLEVSSGSSCTMTVRSDFADLEVSSGSTLVLDGRSDTADIEVSSGSSLKGMAFVIENVDIEVSSGSTAQLGVTNTLIGGVSSGSTLRYSGEPSKVDVDKDISSSVSKR
jgi:hypothetical protein